MHSSFYPFTALKIYFELSVELQLTDAESLNLTLYSLSNKNSLHIHPPEEEEEEEEEKRMKNDDEGQRNAFYCCFPDASTFETANQSRCLLWLTNQTVLTATATGQQAPKGWCQDESSAVSVVSWPLLKLERKQ